MSVAPDAGTTMGPMLDVDSNQAQLNPYRALQLGPGAPIELVAEAYWLLIARTQRELPRSGAVERRILALNSAYEQLMDEDIRSRYEGEAGTKATASTKRPVSALEW